MTYLGKIVFVDIYARYSAENNCQVDDKVADYKHQYYQEFLSKDSQLSLAFENLIFMPYNIIEKCNNSVDTLDLSHNNFKRNLQFLSEFDNVTSLNFDHNKIDSDTVFPRLPKLELLWINHNNIDDLFPFLKNLSKSMPNLRYLSLMGNKAAPSYLNSGTFYDYLRYRLFVISWFPRLVHLDDCIITKEQKQEAQRLFRQPIFEKVRKIFMKNNKEENKKLTNRVI